MSGFLKILLFVLILYFLFNWIKQAFVPNQQKNRDNTGVRIFKKGKIEESKMDMKDAETIDFEEIKDTDKLSN